MAILTPEPLALPAPGIIDALTVLAECVCTTLAVEGAGETCWCGVHPGAAVSWDYCSGGECRSDTCGMAWVRPTTVFPYDAFAQPVIDLRCAHPLAWGVEVGSLRCMPQPSSGELLSPEESMEVTWGQVLDARAIHNALKCCDIKIAPVLYTPVGPQGGCVGGYWTAFLDIQDW
jgi:hypothetical protein